MIRVLVKIFKGLVGFFRIVKTILIWLPRLFAMIWTGVTTLFNWLTMLPSGLAVLGVLALSLGIFLLITKH